MRLFQMEVFVDFRVLGRSNLALVHSSGWWLSDYYIYCHLSFPSSYIVFDFAAASLMHSN